MRSKTWKKNEEGSATIIALLIMVLLMAFVALAVSRTTTETLATANDETESKTFAAAQASLENATREFDQIFETKLTPSSTDIDNVENSLPPGFDTDFDFDVEITQTAQPYTASAGSYLQGLTALRDEWRIDSVVKHKATGVEVALRRAFFNDRIPIFQFGIFYNDDLEFHPGPRFDFGGRVHSNGNLFLMADTGLYFSSKVSAVGQVVTDVARNGRSSTEWGNNVFIRNGSGSYVQLGKNGGSVLHDVVNGTNVFASPGPGGLPMPSAYKNANWPVVRESFQGNLLSEAKRLDLPLKISSRVAGAEMDYIELIRRGKEVGDKYNAGGTPTSPTISNVTTANADGAITTKERYTNKPGIRISLADSRDRLPGCASAAATSNGSSNANRCGVRLDGASNGKEESVTAAPSTGRGYQPKNTINTKVNGDRMYFSTSAPIRENWIKIEMVSLDTSGVVVATDITEDILALGVTERAPTITTSGTTMFRLDTADYDANADKYSIIKLQRWLMPGGSSGGSGTSGTDGGTRAIDTKCSTTYAWNGLNYEMINATHNVTGNAPTGETSALNRDFIDCTAGTPSVADSSTVTKTGRFRLTTGQTPAEREIAPFPIRMFDTREGLYNDSLNISTNFDSTVSSVTYQKVPENGVMGMVDIDVANLRLFLNGDATVLGMLPASGTKFSDAVSRRLTNTDVPDANGWVVYVSDRRGDFDYDGEFDMEDIFGNNNGTKEPGEDINFNNVLDVNYTNEAPHYSDKLNPDAAAVKDTKWFRRGVRLINGTVLPGTYNSGTPANTKGFTFASENGVYVFGNYNATGINNPGAPTDPDDYQPHDTVNHIPASVVGDAITILSNNWNDGRSFRYPFTLGQRQATDTVVRFAMLSGDAISSIEADPNQGGGDPRLTGGVHNFKRFLEDWGGNRLSYSGSLINLYNSHSNNGAFKCCTNVYSPPNRDWTFDISFMDPTRLPPGTPFFQSIQLTGFQRLND